MNNAVKYKIWLKNHPGAITHCKFCTKPLGREMVLTGQDFHTHCLKLKSQGTRNSLAVHAHDPFGHPRQLYK